VNCREKNVSDSSSELIDAKIAALGDWQGEALARIRSLIKEADPNMVEEVKWRKPSNPNGVPVWEHAGILCIGETYKSYVKLTFARGADIPDPDACSIPAWRATPAAPSTSARGKRSTERRSRPLSVPPSR
jgi:hypothetical protein